jgi:hypothetical protein
MVTLMIDSRFCTYVEDHSLRELLLEALHLNIATDRRGCSQESLSTEQVQGTGPTCNVVGLCPHPNPGVRLEMRGPSCEEDRASKFCCYGGHVRYCSRLPCDRRLPPYCGVLCCAVRSLLRPDNVAWDGSFQHRSRFGYGLMHDFSRGTFHSSGF